jgi:hypothetical protein
MAWEAERGPSQRRLDGYSGICIASLSIGDAELEEIVH